jgi:hypothetical protein
MNRIANIYHAVLIEISAEMNQRGYVKSRDETDPHTLGSRLVEYRRGRQVVRFAWDGRAQEFLIQYAPDDDQDEWQDVAYSHYNILTNDDYQDFLTVSTLQDQFVEFVARAALYR